MSVCEHMKEAKDLQPAKRVCEECIKIGDDWVHLRICLDLRPRRMLRFVEKQTRD